MPETENMVLRTLYLPLETDRQLKALAFTRDVSKGELMRELIKQGLASIAASGERSLVEQLSARLPKAQPTTATKKADKPKSAIRPQSKSRAGTGRGAAGKGQELAAAG